MFYRKYRPQNVAELDNQKIREGLGKALLENQWGHAYLFVGSKGTGKTSMARILAKIVNCPNRKKGGEPCNRCPSCVAITKGNSLDVIEIDAASNTGVEDIRSLREKVRLAPTASPYKVYIIDEAHMLSTSAFNALLKTLEEPPAHAIFVLATTQEGKLPETIVSRCLVYDFGKVTQKEIVGSLSRAAKGEGLRIEAGVLELLADKSSGSFRDAHKLLEQLSMQSAKLTLDRLDNLNTAGIENVSEELLKLLVSGKKAAALKLVEENSKKIKDLINRLISDLRDILLFRNGVQISIKDPKISSEEINELILALIEASTLIRDCPVPQLPLEMVIVEFYDEKITTLPPVAHNGDPDFWQKVLDEVKKQNHNLVALLRASRPGELKDNLLTLEVFYKFHKEKLEEPKNRAVLEKAVSDIMGQNLKLKFVLGGEKHGNV